MLALAVAAPLAGCGDNDNEGFTNCGNGTLDAGEECDDGNLDDDDDCLSTCVDATCGDDFVNAGQEECDGGNLAGETCTSLGFGSGTLDCDASCSFDTSGCGTGATATPTPAGPTPTPTPSTPGGDTPTPTPTVAGPTCASGDQITVQASLDTAYGGAVTRVAYPPDAVNIPGSFGDASVVARVTFAAAGGIKVVNDLDTDQNAVDDTLFTSLAGTELVPAGTFVTAVFDCLDGATIPTVASFPCTVESASDDQGNPLIGVQCSVAVSGP
jgi:cysteine-rich repeat protein